MYGSRDPRRSVICVAAAVFAAVLALPACSNDRETLQAANAPIGVEITKMFLTVENRTGGPLLGAKVTIQPAGAPPFTRLLSRIETAAKLDVAFGEFSSRDGTPFNLRLHHPRTVRVEAKDMMNKSYEVEVPWR